jgi:hypothetical protein
MPWLHGASSSQQTDHSRDGEENDCDEEDELGDLNCRAGNTAETKESRDKRDDQKRDSPTEHGVTSHYLIDVKSMTSEQRQARL